MKTIDNWHDLRPYGIDILTGEACGIGYRYLCDVTEKGRKLLATVFGISDFALAEAWNQGTADDPHVGSIMLAYTMLTPIGIFALLENGCAEVWLRKDGQIVGLEAGDDREMLERWKGINRNELMREFHYRGTAGARNVHRMSGRIE